MKRRLAPFLILILLACRTLAPGSAPAGDSVSPVTSTAAPAPTATAAPPTVTPTPAPSATLTLPTLHPAESVSETGFTVRYHPDGGIFVGDLVSFEVIAPDDLELADSRVQVSAAGNVLGEGGFGGFGIGGRFQATLRFVWDTAGLAPGEYELGYQVVPGGAQWTETVELFPAELRPFPGGDSVWAMEESDCCLFYFLTDTAAARDIELLMDLADQEAEIAIGQFNVTFEEPIEVVFLPRVLGHGGFASGEIYISYLDRNYAGNAPAQVLHHEMVHILDGRVGGKNRPSIFVEGLAVYLSGGHFKKEPLSPRAAALFELGEYIPLEELSQDFYFAQHEISYLQGAALIEFMVETWGYDAFDAFYRSIPRVDGAADWRSIGVALQTHFGISPDALEAQFIEYLNAQPADPTYADDVRVSVLFFDTVRRYQQALDPSAYFLTAWLVGIDEALEQGVTADFLRNPTRPENLALETLLVSADRAFRMGDFPEAERYLGAVNAVLDGLERLGEVGESPFYADPLAADYLSLVLAALDAGYIPQSITLEGELARIWGQAGSAELVELSFVREAPGWRAE